MKNKIEISILSGLIVLLSLYIVFRDNKSINYEIPKLEKFVKEDITKITYEDFTITKKGDLWFLPSGYEAQTSKIDRMINEAASLKLIDMISDNKDYQRFGLDKSKTLKVFKNDQLLLELLTGNSSNTGNYTYIKLPNRDEVYSVRGSIESNFNKTEEDLRDKLVLSLNAEEVTEVKITKGSEVIAKSGEDLKPILDSIQSLNANNFNDLKRENELLTVEVVGKTTKTLTVFKKVGEEYPALSSDVDFPFTLPSWIVDKINEIE